MRRRSRLLRIHGLACRKSAGRHNLCDITPSMTLSNGTADIPALLEPKSLSRDDGKRPDCAAMGKRSLLSLGFHVSGHPHSQFLNRAVVSPGSVTNDVEDRNTAKYLSLSPLYNISSPSQWKLLGLLMSVQRIFQKPRSANFRGYWEGRSSQFLFQRLSVAIQRGNAAYLILFYFCKLIHVIIKLKLNIESY